MSTKTQLQKIIGETYSRDYFEVQMRSLEKESTGRWSVHSRNAKTLAEAKAQIQEAHSYTNSLRWFIDTGKFEARIVHVKATCEVVA